MRAIIDKFGKTLDEHDIKEIIEIIYQKVEKKYRDKEKLPTRVELVGFLYKWKGKKEYNLDLRSSGQLEEAMEDQYNDELNEMKYKLLNKYNKK